MSDVLKLQLEYIITNMLASVCSWFVYLNLSFVPNHERGTQIHRFGIKRKKIITPHPENSPFLFIVVAWMGIFLRKNNMTTLNVRYKLFI